ncbi:MULTISPECIES: proline-rich domain-containing protein [unclassified Streptomyces]|uniref:proline-rich domain-containing protein n=1 Tax=unclassified Streptomyces TaxID=2593676 RepID=UPI0037140CD0
MSTTTTGSDPGEPRRRRLRAPGPLRAGTGRRDADRRATEPEAGPRRRPLVLTDRQQRRLIEGARKRGAGAVVGRGRFAVRGRAARSGALDPWVLGSSGRVPYFAELASVRDMLQEQLWEQAADVEEAELLRDDRARSDVEAAEVESRLRDELLREADGQVRSSWRQLNRLAARAVRWERFRDSVRERVELRWIQARFPDAEAGGDSGALSHPDGAPPGGRAGQDPDGRRGPATVPGDGPDGGPADDDWQSIDPTGEPDTDRPPAGRGSAPGEEPEPQPLGGLVPPPDPGWEGMPERPGMPAWLTWAMLLAIAAVEIPIYWIAFQPFHGKGSTGSDVLSGTLAISTAVLMVLLPHLAGRTVRSRAATGSIKAAVFPALALMGVWGFSGWALGDLRARLVLQHPDAADLPRRLRGFNGSESLDVRRTLADNLHLTQETVTWMFVALLFLSGGIGFLLGLLREHPYVDAYRAALERRANRFRQREEARVAGDRARSLARTAQERSAQRREAVDARVRATDNLYEAAAHAFLEGAMERSSDPAVTEAAMKLSATWPLLPRRPRPPVRPGP